MLLSTTLNSRATLKIGKKHQHVNTVEPLIPTRGGTKGVCEHEVAHNYETRDSPNLWSNEDKKYVMHHNACKGIIISEITCYIFKSIEQLL